MRMETDDNRTRDTGGDNYECPAGWPPFDLDEWKRERKKALAKRAAFAEEEAGRAKG